MYESITQIIIYILTAFALLILAIVKNLRNRIDKNEAEITRTRDTLLTEYATKNDVNTLTDRIIVQLNRIENKLDHKRDK